MNYYKSLICFLSLLSVSAAQENSSNITLDDVLQNITDELFEDIFTWNLSNVGSVDRRSTRLDFLTIWLNAMRGFLADDMMNFIIDRTSEEVNIS